MAALARGRHDGPRAAAPLPARGCPADALGPVLPLLGRLRRRARAAGARAARRASIEGEIPAARVHELRRQLPALTRGEGVLESEFARYVSARRGR